MSLLNSILTMFHIHDRSVMMAITPRWAADKSCWVFDDADAGLQAEPFVIGMNEIIDRILGEQGLLESAKQHGFKCEFSSQTIPGESAVLKLQRAEAGGAWYRYKELEGWLCPALMIYFQLIPGEIHARASRIK